MHMYIRLDINVTIPAAVDNHIHLGMFVENSKTWTRIIITSTLIGRYYDGHRNIMIINPNILYI